METVIFKVFSSVSAEKPVMERILYPVSGLFLDYSQIINSLHQLFGDGSVVVISHEKVKK